MNETAVDRPGALRRLYEWVLGLADTRYGVWALAALACAESSCFPIPPDVLLLALCLGKPRRSFRFALICSACSVLGGIGGYFIGYSMEPLGRWLITHLASSAMFDRVADMYGKDAFFYITVAAFTPIPYKVFTIAAGMFHESIPLSTLVLASMLGRTARFLLVAGLVYRYGAPVRVFIAKYFNRLMWVFLVLLILGFAALKLVGGDHSLELDATLTRLHSPLTSVRTLRIERLRVAASRTFGFDPHRTAEDPLNEPALRAIRHWFAAHREH